MARDEAKRILGEVVKGGDPAGDKQATRRVVTVAELCDAYWADVTSGRLLARAGRPKKASTLLSDAGRIERHIKPLLGRAPVAAVTRHDIERLMHGIAEGKTAARNKTSKKRGLSNVRGGRGVAARTVSLLGAIMAYALDRGIRPDNPAHRVRKFAENKRERRLSDGEYALLGKALRDAEGAGFWPPAISAIRFLALTGWRSGEALGLRWAEVDVGRCTARLGDTKTGASLRPLSLAASGILRIMPRLNDHSLVFAAPRGQGTMSGFRSIWDRIARLGGLPGDITPHVLRHSYASVAADLGYSEPTIAALVGHKGRSTTSRYVHSADAVLLAAADAVARRIQELMGEAQSAELVQLDRA